jgi:type II secretory pathway predicted ATPase ExeA
MYLEHFGFGRHPFRMAPEEDFLYMSQQHSRAFIFMDSAIWSPEGFVVISGEIGSGKTTLLKKMISDIKAKVKAEVKLFHIAYSNLKGDDLFQTILQQAGIPWAEANRVSLLCAINDHLRQLADQGIPVLLAIDEAQNLRRENLEDIRLLAGMESAHGPILRVILLGQPELKHHIAELPQLSQRVKLFFHLEGLPLDDTEQYIHHRLSVAGIQNRELFPTDIIKLVHDYSGGIPRLINKISDGLLLCAFADDRAYLLGSDIAEIQHELLLSTDHISQPQNAPERAKETTRQTLSPALERIAAALESIDLKLAALAANVDEPKVRLLRDARNRLQDGKV